MKPNKGITSPDGASQKENSHHDSVASSASTEQGRSKRELVLNGEKNKSEEEAAEAITQHTLKKKMEQEKQISWRSPTRIGASIYRQTEQGEIRPAGASVHPMPNKADPEIPLEDDEATWKDVMVACCCHSMEEWFYISGGIMALLMCLYFFLLGLELLGTSFKVVGGCTAGDMLGSDTNPIASVMIGIVATALLQSSSTTTAIIVSLVSGGLDVKAGIYMVFGANVGTR